jgi:hypothetical protein
MKFLSEPFHIPGPRLIWACRVVERGRFNKNLNRLRRVVGPLNQFARDTGNLRQLFPLLAVLDALEERGAFEPRAFRSYRERKWWKWMQSAFGLMLMRVWHNWLGQYVRRDYPDRPGWNDYYMTLWCMTGNPIHALELYRRAALLPRSGASELDYYRASSCRWMVSSMRQQHPDFDRAITDLEQRFGVPLLSVVPSPQTPA